MEAIKKSLVILLFIVKTISDVNCEQLSQLLHERFSDNLDKGCTLSLDSIKTPTPVFFRNGKYLATDPSGAISVPRSGTIVVACPGHGRSIVLGNSTTSYDVMEAHCITSQTFRVDRWIGSFDQITCNASPYIDSQLSARRCLNGGKIYEIGYKIKNKFYPLYEACFDQDNLSTHYVKHELLPTSIFVQKSGSRPNFIEGPNNIFGKVKMSMVYKIENQKVRLDTILGANVSQNFITKKQFLTKGHLAPRADFTFRADMRASFHYVNAAPQWQRGNAGDWAALEDALRRRVSRLQRPVTVYTGTHGTLTLPDARGVYQSISLSADENNNPLVPVPLYFYKLVYDKKTKNATAFVSINSLFYNSSRIKELTFCDDLCTESEFSWLKWRPDDGTHSFCCDYLEFTQKIDLLEDLDTRGPFY